MPLVVLVALVLAQLTRGGTSQPASSASAAATASVSATAPPNDPGTVEPCAQVLDALPVQLDGQNPRKVFVAQTVAWGEPPVILTCGVARPPGLVAGSSAPVLNVSGVEWFVEDQQTVVVYTVVDRAVYVQVSYHGNLAQPPLAPISTAILKALPAPVCYVDSPIATAPDLPLCTRRPK